MNTTNGAIKERVSTKNHRHWGQGSEDKTSNKVKKDTWRIQKKSKVKKKGKAHGVQKKYRKKQDKSTKSTGKSKTDDTKKIQETHGIEDLAWGGQTPELQVN